MPSFRSPHSGRFVTEAWGKRAGYKPIPSRKKKPKKKPKPKRKPRVVPEEIFEDDDAISDQPFDEELFFDQADALEEFEFDELADLDIDYADFLDEIIDEFEDVEESDYEDAA